MSRTQRWVLRVMPPSRRADIERESREWTMTCPGGHTTSIWEMGGVRYKARSVGKISNGRCATCGVSFIGSVTRSAEKISRDVAPEASRESE